ncbi:ninein isoform X2 [Dendrobates tinctorius]|uniref:ninein isoform X2 n=1 Tax=Dendrobates tinctorius TaxID=92724 RepID=UPI003CC94188
MAVLAAVGHTGGYGMEQDQYEARLKELFDSFDTTGTGSLGQEELTDLCHMLQLEEVAPSLQQVLLLDNPLGRIHFDQFKEALIDALSSTLSSKENCPEPDCSPEAQPKYIKDGKRYGRRSVPELQDSLEEFDEETVIEPEDEVTRSSQVSSRNCEELWRSEEGDEYEAEGQLRFWNPDDLSASQTVLSPEQDWVDEKLQLICEDLGITRDGHLNRKKLLSICEQYGFQNLDKEALEDALQNLDQEDTMSLQDFFYEVCKNTKPPTPSSSTPYRQLKRHLSLQPYDESGRRTLTPSAMTGTICFRLFSKLDDGMGYGSVEDIIDLWHEEGLENGPTILKALDFNLEGKLNLTELTLTLENELLITKNEIYQAALISFRSEIRHLLERTDQTMREKDKLRMDLEKNEKLKSLMASEVDDHHAAIERHNEYNIRKLDEEYKERTAALKMELRKEREQILQQTNRQRLELEQELDKIKLEENYLRDRLTLSIKENSRMEKELLETSEKLADCELLTAKLQKTLDNILLEKFGDLDPSCFEFFRHEEKLMQVRNEHERQRRELQDRIDELQLELEDYRAQGIRGLRTSLKTSLFDEIDNKNAVDYDQGIGSEDCPPLNMSIEAEMAIEQLREQHQREIEQLKIELESKVTHYEENLREAKCVFEREQDVLKQKLNEEIHKAEEQTRVYKKRHLELEADISRLKEEQRRAECEHRNQTDKMEAEFSNQKLQLMEQKAALQLQLEEAKEIYHKEKEELVQRAEDLEKKTENKLVELVTTYEEKRSEMEQSFNDQILGFQEKHDMEKLELRSQLLEKNNLVVQEERKNLETEYNRRLLENEAQFISKNELEVKNYERDLFALKEKFKADLKDLRDQHAEEKSQWAFEKGALIQESVELQEKLKEKIEKVEKEKHSACSELSQGKDLLEKTYKQLVNSLQSEKAQVENDLEKLKIASKQVEVALNEKILQLENDLLEELTERDEQLLQAETSMKHLQAELEDLEKKKKHETEEFCFKLLESETLYKELSLGNEKKRHEMLEEIAKLQGTICELKEEIGSLSRVQAEYKLVAKENLDLKNVVSQLQVSSVLLEEERSQNKSLLAVHEKTVKANVKLLSDMSSLQEKLKNDICNVRVEEKNQYVTLLEEKVKNQGDQLCEAEKRVLVLQETIQKVENDNVVEKDLLNTKLTKSKVLYKEMCDQTHSKRQEMLVEIARFQSTISDLQNEITSLSKIQLEYTTMKKENQELKKLVSDLQDGSALLDEERCALMNLQKVHQHTIKENIQLLAEIDKLQEKFRLTEANKQNGERLDHGDAQHLQETVEKLKSTHKSEKDELDSKLVESEKLYREMCGKYEKESKEIGRLQDAIKELKQEMATLSKTKLDLKMMEKEKEELKMQLQKCMVVPEVNMDVYKSLQAVHEQTVKENVRLLSEMSKLQNKLLWLDSKYNWSKVKNQPAETEVNSFMEPEGEEDTAVLDLLSFSQYKQTLNNVNMKLQNKTKELEDITKMLSRLEQSYNDVKTENGHLKTQTVLLQEKLSALSLEYDQVRKAINLEVIPLPELEDAPISVPGLKLLLAVARKENLQLKESLTVLELKNMDAIDNNKVLSSEVSWLQKEILNMEEMAEASLKLEQLYEEAKKENNDLKLLVQVMQEKLYSMEKTPMTVIEKLAIDLKTEKNVEPSFCPGEYNPSFTTLSMPLVENIHNSAEQQPGCPDKLPRSHTLDRNGGKPGLVPTEQFCHKPSLDLGTFAKGLPEKSPIQKHLNWDHEQKTINLLYTEHEIQNRLKHLRHENETLQEKNSTLLSQITSLQQDAEVHNQRIAELTDNYEDMCVKYETVKKEKLTMEKKVDILITEVLELKRKNEQMASENEELFSKNSRNQEDIKNLAHKITLLLKQKDPEEWKQEIEGYRTKLSDAERELSEVKTRNCFLEQENTRIKQEVESKQLSKNSKVSDLRNEISLLTKKTEKLVKEKEALGDELNRCVAKSSKVSLLENKLASLKQEQKTLEQQSLTLKSQVTASQEKIHSLEENLQSVNLQMARIKSDLRVAQQQKESLKQEVMSLHKQLQHANSKKQVLEMAVQSSGFQNQQKKQYWDDLERLKEQEQHLLRQENERLQRDVQNTKSDLTQSREKVRQLESNIISLKHQKQQSQSSLVKALEQEKSGLRRECEQLQKDLQSANRKVSQLSALERDLETIKAQNEVLRAKQGTYDDPFMEMLHSSSSATHSHSPLQQLACAAIPREQHLQLQVDRQSQQHQASADNRSSDNRSPQTEPELLLRKMEVRMLEVEQKLRIVKMLLQEKVNQLKEQVMRNTRTDAQIKDLYVENSQLLKALEMSKQRHQTAEKKNYLLEEKISGLNKIVRDLTPAGLGGLLSTQRKP